MNETAEFLTPVRPAIPVQLTFVNMASLCRSPSKLLNLLFSSTLRIRQDLPGNTLKRSASHFTYVADNVDVSDGMVMVKDFMVLFLAPQGLANLVRFLYNFYFQIGPRLA